MVRLGETIWAWLWVGVCAVNQLMKSFWDDDDGFVVSLELLLIATILVLGLAASWASLRVAMVAQFAVIENAVLGLNPTIQQAVNPPVVVQDVADDTPVLNLVP